MLAPSTMAPGRRLGECTSAEGGDAVVAWARPCGHLPRLDESAWPEETSGGDEVSCTTASAGPGCDSADPGESSEDAQDSDSDRQVSVAASLPPTDLVARLRCYGYFAQDAHAWQEQRAFPVARLRLNARRHVGGHTHYVIESQLARLGEGKAPLAWSSQMTLRRLREDVHAPLKHQLGGEYERHFRATPFARRSGPPGTTARLHAWFQSLAACMTAGYLSPALTATVLEALQAPCPAESAAAAAPQPRPPESP